MFPDIKTNSCYNALVTYDQPPDGYIVVNDEPDDLTYFHLFCYLVNVYIFTNMSGNNGA